MILSDQAALTNLDIDWCMETENAKVGQMILVAVCDIIIC